MRDEREILERTVRAIADRARDASSHGVALVRHWPISLPASSGMRASPGTRVAPADNLGPAPGLLGYEGQPGNQGGH
jgi:hypothetical protein